METAIANLAAIIDKNSAEMLSMEVEAITTKAAGGDDTKMLEEIAKKKTLLEQLVATKEKYAQLLPPVIPKERVPGNLKQTLKLELPKFNDSYSKNPEIFIKVLVNTLQLNHIQADLWRSYLGSALEGSKHRMWFAKLIEAKGIEDWNEIVKQFIERLQVKDRKTKSVKLVNTIRQRDDETCAEYIDRFGELVFDAGMEETDASALAAFGDGIRGKLKKYYAAINPVMNIVKLSDAYSLLLKLDVEGRSKKPVCKICKKPNHNEKDCWHKEKKMEKKDPKFSNKRQEVGEETLLRKRTANESLPIIKCFKCQEEGHKANNCPKKVKINAIVQENSDGIKVPLVVNGERIYAILDTGADRTCIDADFARNNLKCELTKYCGDVLFAGCVSSNDFYTGVVEIVCGKYSISHEVICFKMIQDYSMLLGRDLMPVFNLEVRGIPFSFTVPKCSGSEMDFSECLAPMVESVVSEEVLAKIKDGIRDNLMENGQINRADLCSLPYAIVALETGTAAPVCKRQYKIAHNLLDQIQERIDQWLQTGTISSAPIDCEWNSPLVAAPKKDEFGSYTKLRLCLDTRGLNSVLKDVNYNLPLVKDIFDKISGFTIASRLDLADSFNQLPIKLQDREKTTFTFGGKRYQFNGAPFGIKILTAHLQKVLTRLLEPFQNFVAIFVDDIVVFSDSVENHILHLNLVIDALNKANLKLREEKCLFGCTELVVLGHVISGDSIKADPSKLSAFQNIPTPSTGKQLESFLGTTSYLRDYIPLYSRIAAPLERIRKTKGSLNNVWTEECNIAFESFKKILSSPPVLSTPDFNHEFCVGTDASNSGVGAVLYQTINGVKKFICFVSSALSDSQRNYPATKKELLAIVFALKKFREWLWGSHFTLYTDHMSLIYLFDNSNENLMFSNWADQILDYNFSVVHCPGVQNILPDYLSRIYADCNPIKVLMTNTTPTKPNQELKTFIQERFDKVEPPEGEREEILTSFHIINHQGADQ